MGFHHYANCGCTARCPHAPLLTRQDEKEITDWIETITGTTDSNLYYSYWETWDNCDPKRLKDIYNAMIDAALYGRDIRGASIKDFMQKKIVVEVDRTEEEVIAAKLNMNETVIKFIECLNRCVLDNVSLDSC